MPTDDDVLAQLAEALDPGERAPSPARVAALRDAVSAHAAAQPDSTRLTSRRVLRLATPVFAVAASVAVFILGGAVLGGRDATERNEVAGANPEFAVTLVSADGSARASVDGYLTGIGRVVQLRTDDLPILPTGQFYELWFVGPGDSPNAPNRISAGTFHPDERGRSHVDFAAAVNPKLYPTLSITAEPGDGDPRPSGPDVLRASITFDP